jgi:hypothetical protein
MKMPTTTTTRTTTKQSLEPLAAKNINSIFSRVIHGTTSAHSIGNMKMTLASTYDRKWTNCHEKVQMW